MTKQLKLVTGPVGRFSAWIRWAVAIVLGIGFLLWLLLVAPRLLVPAASEASLREVPAAIKWQVRDSRLKLQNEARTTLLQGLGGLAVLVGAVYTFWQVQTSRRQLEVAQQGQVTERFTRAIEQLGQENLDVRLGGIYALERIANDSPQDRVAIVAVLTAFVRGHSPWPPTRAGQYIKDAPIESVPPLRARAQDVQATLGALGRPLQSEQRLDLAATDLRRAYLVGAQLQGAYLTDAHLHRALLTNANLQGAWLARAQLQETDLVGAQLQGAYLNNANLQWARLARAQLQEADLSDAQLHGAVCNADTSWPVDFDWKAAGVIAEDVD